MSTGQRRLALGLIMLIALATRFVGLENAPPGINHDEASNGYDAYSILKTGQDRWGHSWPVLLEAFGRADFRGALYAYLVVPFHLLAGDEHLIISTRLPAAILGVLTIAALYYLVARVSNPAIALWAALFLCLSPWHIQLSRFGHESSLTPVCTVLALALLVRAGWPMTEYNTVIRSLSSASLAASAAVVTLSLYSYPSMRLFTPAFLIAFAWIYRRTIDELLRQAPHRRMLGCAAITACLVAGPIIWIAITQPDHLFARTRQVFVFQTSESWVHGVRTFITQYAAHFGPNWLALRGDAYIIQSPRGFGQLNIVMIPLLVIGVYQVVKHRNESPLNVLLLAWLLIHPLAAALSEGGPHALRSACGIPVFQWIAAIGCQWLVNRIGRTAIRRTTVSLTIAMAISVNGACFINHYFRVWARDPRITAMYQRDLCNALRVIRPIVDDYDVVFISDQRDFDRFWHSAEAYILTLLVLPVAPDVFHNWEKTVDYERPEDGFHRVGSFGPFVMTTRSDVLADSFQKHPRQSALIIARPGEITGGKRLATIPALDGSPRFEIISVRPH